MATNPQQGSAPRASSILSQTQTGPALPVKALAPGTPLSVTTKPWVSLRRALFTVADVGTQKLYDVLYRMQENLFSVLGVVVTNQLVPGNIIRGATFTTAQTRMLSHGLGRPWQGYFCIRAVAGSGAPVFTDVAYVSGATADLILPLLSANAGTYDIYVF